MSVEKLFSDNKDPVTIDKEIYISLLSAFEYKQQQIDQLRRENEGILKRLDRLSQMFADLWRWKHFAGDLLFWIDSHKFISKESEHYPEVNEEVDV